MTTKCKVFQLNNIHPDAFLKDILATEKASALKRTPRNFKFKTWISSPFLPYFSGQFYSCGSGSGSSRPKPMLIHADLDLQHCWQVIAPYIVSFCFVSELFFSPYVSGFKINACLLVLDQWSVTGNCHTGLRKVADNEKTHKNPALRGGSVVITKEKAPAPTK